MTEVTFSTLANRFRSFDFDKPMPEKFTIVYKDNSSLGNRYQSWRRVVAYLPGEEAPLDAKVIDLDRVYEETKNEACEWGYFFNHIHYGFIKGPKTTAAVAECLDILRNDNPPEDDGTKVRHVNRMGGVNYISKPTLHEWDLTDKLARILADAFFADRNDRNLYSNDFTFVFNSYSGWNRAS